MNKEILVFSLDSGDCFKIFCSTNGIFKFDGTKYFDVYDDRVETKKFDGYLGFYDWLVSENNEVVGVYLALDSASEDLIRLIGHYRTVELDEDKLGISFLFCRGVDYSISVPFSQSFGFNRVFATRDEEYIVTFEMPPKDLNRRLLGLDD